MGTKQKLRERVEELRAWSGLIWAALSMVVFLGALSTANAGPIPRVFLEIFLESRGGTALLPELRRIPQGAQRVQFLETYLRTPRMAQVRQLIEERAILYGEVIRTERELLAGTDDHMGAFQRVLSGETPVARMGPRTRTAVALEVYTDLSASDRAWMRDILDRQINQFGLADIGEFLPRPGHMDWVGMTRPRAPAN